MQKFIKGEFIDHWENGIGKVVDVSPASVTVSYWNGTAIEVPIEKTAYFKKVSTTGFLAFMSENLEAVEKLFQEKSVDLVKLLIEKEGAESGRSVKVNHIKSILTQNPDEKRNWRKNSCLISVKEWKKWWQEVERKLKGNPLFDIGTAGTVSLRDHPIPDTELLADSFISEKSFKKKLMLCEKILKKVDHNSEDWIPEGFVRFLDDSLEKYIGEPSLSGAVLYIGILARNKDFKISTSDKLSFKNFHFALGSGNLPVNRQLAIYSYLSKLPNQLIDDHLITWLMSEPGFHSAIAKLLHSLTRKDNITGSQAVPCTSSHPYLETVNSWESWGRELLKERLSGLRKSLPNHVAHFFANILSNESITPFVKDVFAETVFEFGMSSTILVYCRKVKVADKFTEELIAKSLRALDPGACLRCLRDILLTTEAMKYRREVFLIAAKCLFGGQVRNIKPKDKEDILKLIGEGLSSLPPEESQEIRKSLKKIPGFTDQLSDSEKPRSDTELAGLVRSETLELDSRRQALEILIQRKSMDVCKSIATDFSLDPSADRTALLGMLLGSFPETLSSETFLMVMIKKWAELDQVAKASFIKWLNISGRRDHFYEILLNGKRKTLASSDFKKYAEMMEDEQLREGLMRFIWKNIIPDPDSVFDFGSAIRLLTFFPAESMEFIVSNYRAEIRSKKSEMDQAAKSWAVQLDLLAKEQDHQVRDAIEKTQKRYEEYLLKAVPILGQLEEINETLLRKNNKKTDEKLRAYLTEKISVIKEDLEIILVTLGIKYDT